MYGHRFFHLLLIKTHFYSYYFRGKVGYGAFANFDYLKKKEILIYTYRIIPNSHAAFPLLFQHTPPGDEEFRQTHKTLKDVSAS
jgi:hypothetical protein